MLFIGPLLRLNLSPLLKIDCYAGTTFIMHNLVVCKVIDAPVLIWVRTH